MTMEWRRVAKNVWRLDDHWQIVEETPRQWRCYRDGKPLLEDFPGVAEAMAGCERLRGGK